MLNTCDLARPMVRLRNISSSGKIKITWDEVEGASKYQIYRSTSKNGTYELLKTVTGTSKIDSHAEVGNIYYYKVVAVGEDNNAISDFSEVKSRACDLPSPEVFLATRNSAGKPKLAWNSIKDANVYQIYRATSRNGEYKLVFTTEKCRYTNTGAKAGVTYYYKILAVHSKNVSNSDYSDAVFVKSK